MTQRERRDDFVYFMRKVGIVAGAALAVLTLGSMTWGYALAKVHGVVAREVTAQDSVLIGKVDRIERRLEGVNDMLIELLKKEAKR